MGRALGNIAGAVAPIVAGYYGGPAGLFGLGATGSAIAAGALTGAGIAGLRGDDMLMGAAAGGLGGYGGGNLQAAFNPATAAVPQGSTTAVMNQELLSPYTSLSPNATAGNLGMMSNPTALSGTAGSGGFGGIQGLQGSIGPNMGQINKLSVNPGVTNPLSRVPGQLQPSQSSSGLSTGGGYVPSPNEIIPPAELNTMDKFSAGIERLGGGDKVAGYGKLALTAAPVVGAGLTPEYETFEDVMSEDVYDPNSQLNLNMDTGIREAMQKDSGLRLYRGGGTVSPNRSNPGRLNFGMAKALNNMQVTNNNTGAAVNTAGMTPDEIFKRYYRNKNKFSGPKFEEGGGVIGVSSSPGLPIAGATMGGGMAESVSETMAAPGGFDTFESMVASGIDPANAAAMFGMDTDPYLDTGPGMTYTSPPRTSPIRGGISELPPPPSMFTPTPEFDDEYTGGYMTPSRMKSVGMEPGYSGRTRRYERLPMATGGYLDGGMLPGDGMSDDVPAMIDGTQKAALSQGEFVIPADVVSHLGNGSSDAGSKQLYGMMDKIRKARTGTKKQGKEINPERFMPS